MTHEKNTVKQKKNKYKFTQFHTFPQRKKLTNFLKQRKKFTRFHKKIVMTKRAHREMKKIKELCYSAKNIFSRMKKILGKKCSHKKNLF